jgi:hypothetical protein
MKDRVYEAKHHIVCGRVTSGMILVCECVNSCIYGVLKRDTVPGGSSECRAECIYVVQER